MNTGNTTESSELGVKYVKGNTIKNILLNTYPRGKKLILAIFANTWRTFINAEV